jgi:hypothetical protein
MKKFELGPKDKQRASHGFGSDFRHTDPQRRVPCIVGDMLAPASADDIPPIPESAAYSARKAFELLANLVGDRDHNLYLGNADRDGKATREAEVITRACDGVLAILRVKATREFLYFDLLNALDKLSADLTRRAAEAGDAAPDVCGGPVADVVFAYRRFKEKL